MFPEPEKTVGYEMHQEALNKRVPVHWEAFSPNLKVWVDAHAYPSADGGLSVYFSNISECKQAEQLMIDNETRLEKLVHERTSEMEEAKLNIANILESIKDPFFTLDSKWRFVYVNHPAQEQLTYIGSLSGQDIWNLFPKMVGGIFWDKYHQVMDNKMPLCFEAKTEFTGFWSHVSVYPFAEGISVLFRDISARKEAEEALFKAKEHLQIPHSQAALLPESDDVCTGCHGINYGKLILPHIFCLPKISFPKEVFQSNPNMNKNQHLI
jgi:PAS domain-containing protein